MAAEMAYATADAMARQVEGLVSSSVPFAELEARFPRR